MTQSEKKFINEYARKLLVEWAVSTLHEDHCEQDCLRRHNRPYFEHALEKGWVGKRTPHRVTSKGFSVAAAFLKR